MIDIINISLVRIKYAASAMMSTVRDCFLISGEPMKSIASVAIAVLGHSAFTAIPSSLSSSLMPNTQKLMPYLAIVYATLFLNHFGFKLSGGEMFNMCGFLLFCKYGMPTLEHRNVPLALT